MNRKLEMLELDDSEVVMDMRNTHSSSNTNSSVSTSMGMTMNMQQFSHHHIQQPQQSPYHHQHHSQQQQQQLQSPFHQQQQQSQSLHHHHADVDLIDNAGAHTGQDMMSPHSSVYLRTPHAFSPATTERLSDDHAYDDADDDDGDDSSSKGMRKSDSNSKRPWTREV